MIKIIMDRMHSGKQSEAEMVQVYGSTEDVVYNLSEAVASIYQSMKIQDKKEADIFQAAVVYMMRPESPVWKKKVEQTTILGVGGRQHGQA